MGNVFAGGKGFILLSLLPFAFCLLPFDFFSRGNERSGTKQAIP